MVYKHFNRATFELRISFLATFESPNCYTDLNKATFERYIPVLRTTERSQLFSGHFSVQISEWATYTNLSTSVSHVRRQWPHSSLTVTGRVRALQSFGRIRALLPLAAYEPYIRWSHILATHFGHTLVTVIGHIHGPHTLFRIHQLHLSYCRVLHCGVPLLSHPLFTNISTEPHLSLPYTLATFVSVKYISHIQLGHQHWPHILVT